MNRAATWLFVIGCVLVGGVAMAWRDPSGGASVALDDTLFCRLTGGCAITDTASVAGALTAGSLATGDGGVSALGGVLTVRSETVKTLTTWDTAAGANMTAAETGLNRQTAQLTISGSPVAIDGGATISGTLAVTGATSVAAITETGQETNTVVGTSGSSYTDATMVAGASIYQHQAATGSYKSSECWRTDGVNEWICIVVSSGGGASQQISMNAGTNHTELYVASTGQYAVDVNGARAQTSSSTLTTFPSGGKVAHTGNSGTCTLNGGTPATCTITVTAGAVCTCGPVGTTAVIAAAGCAVSLSSTTLTMTSGATLTNNVNAHCDR